MVGSYNLSLVLLSFAIAVLASYTALDLASRMQFSRSDQGRRLWLMAGAVGMGVGIWSMHFIAMLAFELPMSVDYDIVMTLLSLLYAVLASGIAFWLLSRSRTNRLLMVGSGVCMGGAIAFMHYTGMAGMRMQAVLHYDPGLVVLSVLIAIGASFGALWLVSRLQTSQQSEEMLLFGQKFGSAIVMGIAVSGMHYTGMLATHFMPSATLLDELAPSLSQRWLAIIVGTGTVGLLSLALFGSMIDQHMALRLVREKALQESEKRFRMLIREMQAGVMLLNHQAEILTCNRAALQFLNLEAEPMGQVFGASWPLLHDDLTPFAMADLPVQQAIARRETVQGVVVGVEQPDSTEPCWLLVNAEPQLNQAGGVQQVVCTLTDITQSRLAVVALQESEARFRQLAETIESVFWMTNPDQTKVLYVSPAYEKLWGRSREEVYASAKAFIDSIHSGDRDRVLATHANAPTESYSEEYRIIRPDGSLRWIRDRAFPVKNEAGQVYRITGIAEDITEFKKAEFVLKQTAERERAIAQIIWRMRQTLDLQTIFRATTDELRQALQSDRTLVYRFHPDWSGELMAESVAEGWHPMIPTPGFAVSLTEGTIDHPDCATHYIKSDDPILWQDTYLQATQGGFDQQGIRYRCVPDIDKAGFNACYLNLMNLLQARAYVIVPIFQGSQLWGLLATYQNSGPRDWEIEEIKMMHQVGSQLGVAIQQAELLAQTQQQAEELREAKDLADSANRAKSEFLANMSHELRTPLNAILGFTQLMNRDPELTAEHQDYLDIIGRSGEHLLELINGVLEMSKIEAGRLTLHETSVDLLRLLEDMEAMLQVKAESKGVQLVFERAAQVPRCIQADEGKLRQVLLNLLGNAIKFTDWGTVTLRVHCREAEGGSPSSRNGPGCLLSFAVKDTGPGIHAVELNQLFQPFEQTSTGMRSLQGTGLGLAISQKFVQLMGGEITVSSQVGVGSCFQFTLPTTVVEQAVGDRDRTQGTVVAIAPGQPTYRLLVAEDSATNRLLMVRLLTRLGFEVREANNGQEALAIWREWHPHLIWMDMQMPIMNGFEAIRQIKATPEGASTVIIALTASAFEEQRQAILAIGCDDFVRKPFQREELLAKISQHLPVQYLYAEPDRVGGIATTAAPTAEPMIANALQAMPADWRDKLHHAAAQCSDRLLLELIDQLPDEQVALATALKQLTENFRFDQITTLIHSDIPEKIG